MNRFPLRLILLGLGLCVTFTRADVLNLLNGDRFIGSVALVNETEVHIKNEVVGLIKVPRAKVASIYFGTNEPPRWSGAAVATPEVAATKNAIDPKAIEQVQKEFLSTATPEANAMFTELVQGLSSGKLSLDDLRNQARDSLKELKELQAEIGEEDDNPLLGSYVSILERFINQGAKPGGTNQTKVAPAKPLAAPKVKLDEE